MINKFKLLLMKRKKGFTLVELLAVIVILAVIMVLIIPTVLGSINNSKQKAFEIMEETIEKYLKENYENCSVSTNEFPKYDKEIFDKNCELIENNLSDNLLKNTGYDKENIGNIELGTDGEGNFELNINPESNSDNICLTISMIKKPNSPELPEGLVPIKYNGSSWVQTTITDPDWYDYDSHKWANAAKYDNNGNINSMFVWIPRFSYTIGCTDSSTCLGYKIEGASDLATATPGAIDIKFVSSSTTETGEAQYQYDDCRNATNWKTHPAFTQDGKKLSGIWVAKFEVSGSPDYNGYAILPSKTLSLSESVTKPIPTNPYHSDEKNIISSLSKVDDDTSLNMHIIRNSEWSAVSYLSQSIYGKYGNEKFSGTDKEIYTNNFTSSFPGLSYYNGYYKYDGSPVSNDGNFCELCGMGASTTGTIYGIYDMSGGTNEAVQNDTEDNSNLFSETKGWYNDTTPSNTIGSWIIRGGQNNDTSKAGIFAYAQWNGIYNGGQAIRPVITN